MNRPIPQQAVLDEHAKSKGPRGVRRRALLLAAIVVSTASAAAASGAPPHESDRGLGTVFPLLYVLLLGSIIGLGVVTRVSRLLHTPLMSLTNAISAIAVVGAILVTGMEHEWYITLLGAVALFSSMTNIVSGFLITDRMLKMFKTGPGKGSAP